MDQNPKRRTVLSASTGLVAAGVLSACRPSDDVSTGTNETDAAAGPGVELAPTSEVPVGESKLVGEGNAQVFLSHPSENEFIAFAPSCTHQGCTVRVQDAVFYCPCHGSEFNLDDGAVLKGPADKPLIEREVTVENGTVYLAT